MSIYNVPVINNLISVQISLPLNMGQIYKIVPIFQSFLDLEILDNELYKVYVF